MERTSASVAGYAYLCGSPCVSHKQLASKLKGYDWILF